MSASWRSIADLSAWATPPGIRLMGAFKGYFDESGKDTAPHNALAFCGYVCTVDGWKAFEDAWQTSLDANDVPYLHMKELQCDPHSPLAKFAGKENQDACAKLLGDVTKVIASSGLTCAGALIRLPDLKEFNARFGLNLQALPLAMYLTMNELYRLFPNGQLELIVDRLEEPEKTIALAVDYAASHVHDDVSELMSWFPLKGVEYSKNIPPIQAADFVAWEARKEHELKNDWWTTKNRGLPIGEWIPSMTAWLQERGKSWPGHRRSFAGLTKATKIHASVFDYDALCKLHEARHGVWTIEARDRYRWKQVSERSS